MKPESPRTTEKGGELPAAPGPSAIARLVDAIIRMEGASNPKSVNQFIIRNYGKFNPGHIIFSRWSKAHGAEECVVHGRRWAGWPTEQAAREAIRDLLVEYARLRPELDLAGAISRYAPASENDTQRYVLNVERWTGLAATTSLADILNGKVT